MTRKRTFLTLVPALVLGVFLTLVAFPGEAQAASYTWKLETEFKTSFTTAHSQNRLTTNGSRQVLWTFGTQVPIGKNTLQESVKSYTLTSLRTNGLPFKVTVDGKTQQPSEYARVSYVTVTWEQKMGAVGNAIGARTGLLVRAFNEAGGVVATYYDNYTNSGEPKWGVGYQNVQDHSFSLDLISNGTGKASVLYKDGTAYNGEWTNQDLIMRTRDLQGANLVNLFSTNYNVPSISTWSSGSTLDQPITAETSKSGDLYFVRIKDTVQGQLSANIGSTNVRIDKTKPTPKASFDAETGTFKDESTDALSGVKLTQIKITDGPKTSDWTDIDDVKLTTTGKYVLVIRTTDNAGNVEQVQMVVELTKTPTAPEPEVKPEVKPETKPENKPNVENLGDGFSISISSWASRD